MSDKEQLDENDLNEVSGGTKKQQMLRDPWLTAADKPMSDDELNKVTGGNDFALSELYKKMTRG